MFSLPIHAEEAPRAFRPLTARESLNQARTRLEQARSLPPGHPEKSARIDDAEKIYTSLLRHPEEEIRLEANFQLAQIRLSQGRFRQAISLFLEILRQRPDLPRVRLELARAYFLDKNYADATFQFELVKGGKLPPEVLINVDSFLDLIRRQKNWDFDFQLAPIRDSNINQVSGGKEECIDTVFGTLCRPLEKKASGYGLNLGGHLEYYPRLSQDWGLRASLSLNGLEYQGHDYDDYTFAAALGPRYLWENGEASLQPVVRKRWIGGKRYNEEKGLRLDSRQNYGRWILNTGASYGRIAYQDSRIHALLRGYYWGAQIQPRYILDARSFVQVGLGFQRDAPETKSYASDNWRYSLGAYHALPYGFALFAEGALTRSVYQAPQWFVTQDNRIDETTRRDKTWQLYMSLSSNALEQWEMTPLLQYTYTRRLSNIWSREYERHRLNLLVNIKF